VIRRDIVPRSKSETYYAFLAETGFSVGIKIEPTGEYVLALASCSVLDQFNKKKARALIDLRLNAPTGVSFNGLAPIEQHRILGHYNGEQPRRDLLMPVMDMMRRINDQIQEEDQLQLQVGDRLAVGNFILRVESGQPLSAGNKGRRLRREVLRYLKSRDFLTKNEDSLPGEQAITPVTNICGGDGRIPDNVLSKILDREATTANQQSTPSEF
jgi:hypothetical protein